VVESQPAAIDEIPLHRMLALDYEPPTPGEGRAQVRMPVKAEALGSTGSLHGGAIATMVDLACALAAVGSSGFDPSRESLVTVDMHIRYLGRARTETVLARAEVIRRGSQLIVVGCEVVDEQGHLVAVADFSMMIVALRTPLVENPVLVAGGPER
jgi:uncharacterized protein (TIGR00369 family)